MMTRNLGIISLFALAAAACSQQPADDSNITIDDGVNAAEAANADVETLPPSESPSSGTEAGNTATPDDAGNAVSPSPTPASAVIPAQYRGRWGMVPADCTSTRGDAKGLITIDGSSIRFYESRAVLKEQRPAIATSFAGHYAFSGEGQTWDKVVTLTRDGDRLKRADADGAYTYTRCA